MNETNSTGSIWRRNWPGAGGVALWILALFAGVFAAVYLSGLGSSLATGSEMALIALISAAALLVVGIPLALFLRWLGHWHNFSRFLFAVACLVTLVALFYVEEDWRGRWDWLRFTRKWESKGEHFTMAGLAPPPVPEQENFAMAPIVRSSYAQILDGNGHRIVPPDTNVVNRLHWPIEIRAGSLHAPAPGNWQEGVRTDLRAWQTYYRQVAAATNWFPVPPQPQSPAADVLFALAKYDAAIEELRQASLRPYSRFPLEYDNDDPAAILLPHLAKARSSVTALRLRAVAELRSGQTAKALEDVTLMLRLSEALDTEPTLISQLVRIAMVNLALQPVWEGLADQLWSEAQLSALEQNLGKVDLVAGYRTAMRGELACTTGSIAYLRKTRRINDLLDIQSPWVSLALRWGPAGWFYQNQLRWARLVVGGYLPVADPEQRTFSPQRARQAQAELDADLSHRNPYNWIEAYLTPALGNAAVRFAWTQTSVDLARVACGLDRYRLAHHEYPETLEALVPQYIDPLPRDVISGKPLHYRRTTDGKFRLYSVGWNETDDGGTVAFTQGTPKRIDFKKGDWVWP
jgi:hypothetical protein